MCISCAILSIQAVNIRIWLVWFGCHLENCIFVIEADMSVKCTGFSIL